MAKKCLLTIYLGLSLWMTNAHATVLQNQSSLTRYPLSQMKMVGTINNGEQIWGIVRMPDNHVYSVTIDNDIGSEHGKVLQVTSQRITVENNAVSGRMNIETLWLSND